MDKLTILKISGVVIVLFLVMLVGAYFLYPKLNEDKYKEVVTEFEKKQEEAMKPYEQPLRPSYPESRKPGTPGSSTTAHMAASVEANQDSIPAAELQTIPEIRLIPVPGVLGMEAQRLKGVVDSLEQVISGLNEELNTKEEEYLALQEQVNLFEEEAAQKEDPAEFKERVKSLLNLDEDELAPILEKMSQDQLVRLYHGGGTLQREKILRSLKSDKAAKLMTEIM